MGFEEAHPQSQVGPDLDFLGGGGGITVYPGFRNMRFSKHSQMQQKRNDTSRDKEPMSPKKGRGDGGYASSYSIRVPSGF